MAKIPHKALIRCLDQGYEFELGRELKILDESFDSWRSGEINCWELEERIHRFHDGPSRDLYRLYRRASKEMTAVRAIAPAYVSEEDVPQPLLESLADSIAFFRSDLETNSRATGEDSK